MTLMIILLVTAVALVFGSFVLGMSAFVREGEEAREKSQKYMRARVVLQGLAVICFMLALMMKG